MDSIRTVAFLIVAAMSIAYNSLSKTRQMDSVTTRTLNASYDYIVVGGGSAGCVVASRLSEDPHVTVLLLEAGGDYTEKDSYHVPFRAFDHFKTDADWEYYTVPQTDSLLGIKDQRCYWPRGKVLGGTSILNAMQYSRGSRYDYDGWEELGCEGWGYDDVLPYFLKSEDMRIDRLKASEYHNTGGEIGVSAGGVTPIADMFLEAGKELGYDAVDYNGESMEGFSPLQLTVRNGIRSSTSLEFLGKTKSRSNLHIGIRSFVTKIAIHKKRTNGVYVVRNERKHFIKAKKEVIISSGVVNSPQLLMLSGIGPKLHLEKLGIDVVVDLPVGENLQDHQFLSLFSTINSDVGIPAREANSWKTKLQHELFGTGIMSIAGADGTAFVNTQGDAKNIAPDIQFVLAGRYSDKNLFDYKDDIAKEHLAPSPETLGFTALLSILKPESVGSIRLKSSDPFDYPLIDPRYLTDKRDVLTFIRGIRIWEKYIGTPTMQTIGANLDSMNLSFCSQHTFQSDTYWECIIRYLVQSFHHPSGTCKMGRDDDETAVVDTELKVKGVAGLRVVDASVIPQAISGNINAAVIMIAEKAADMVRDIHSVKHQGKHKSKSQK